MIKPAALKLYGQDENFCRVVNDTCRVMEENQPGTYETEGDLFFKALEQTYNDYLESLEEERRHFKRYKVTIEVQIDRNLDPAAFFEIFFTDRDGNQHTLREIHEIEEIPC